MSRLTNQLDHVCDDLLRVSHQIQDVESKMLDAQSPLRGQSFEPSSGSQRLYCLLHEGDLGDCPEHDLCTGVPIDAPTDPTGEAGIADPAAEREHRQLVKDVAALEVIAQRVIRTTAAWQQRGPTERERRETDAANIPGCEVCARSGKQVPAKVLHSDVKGWLKRPHRLCRWHHDFVLKEHRLPDETEEASYQTTGKCVVRQMDRLRRGVLTGTLS